jgi:hypothetical protein
VLTSGIDLDTETFLGDDCDSLRTIRNDSREFRPNAITNENFIGTISELNRNDNH